MNIYYEDFKIKFLLKIYKNITLTLSIIHYYKFIKN